MARLVLLVICLTSFAIGHASLPVNERPASGDDAALKRFLLKNNRAPYPNETVSETPTVRPPVRSWTTCEGCKLLVGELRSIINNPQEVANLKQLLSRVCNLGIMSKYKAECLNMVDNLIVVLHQIEPILDDPTAVCQELQYCPDNVQGAVTPAKRVALLLGYTILEGLRPGRSNDIPCDECIFAITELKSLIQSRSIQDELKVEFHKICRMAGQYESECNALVDQYFDLLIQELVQLLNNGRQVCADIGLCNSGIRGGSRGSVPLLRVRPAMARSGRVHLSQRSTSANTPQLELFFSTVKRIQTRQGINAGCLVCRAAFTTIIDALSQEQVATVVTRDLTNFVCSALPDNLKAGCSDFLKIYSRAFLQLALTEFTPPEICSAMHICKPEDAARIDQLTATEKSAAVCEACQLVSQYLSFEFQQPDFQHEVVDTLKRGCRVLPGDYELQVKCQSYVETYLPYVMENVLAPEIQTGLCPTLGVCPGGQASTQTPA